jgi:signal transduction histidine kinase
LDLRDPGCQACHQPGRPADQQNIVFTNSQSQRILRNCNPIANQPSCYQCHDASIRVNGVLITDFSLADTDARLTEDLRAALVLGSGAVALLVLTVNLLMDRIVLARLGKVNGVLRRFGQGDLSQRLTLRSRDELGKLAETFNNMAASLQDKDHENARLYAELQQKEAARAQLLDKVIQAQEEERKRIARDLHDQLGATLSGLTMSIQAAEQSLPDQADGLRERWQRAKNLATEALEETHKMIFDLRPGVLDDLGLVAAIRSDAESHLQPHGIEIQISVTGARRRLTPGLELTLFRIAQEAIINIKRHARAEHVKLTIEFLDSVVTVTLEDDGQGFDPQAVSNSEDKTRGLGLLGMSERASLAGGSLEIESTVGRGTRVVVTMPAPIDGTAEKN